MLLMSEKTNTHAECASFRNIVLVLGTVIIAVLLCVALIEEVVVEIFMISLLIMITASIPYSRSRASEFAG